MNHTPLFPPLPESVQSFFRTLERDIAAVWPLSPAHRRSLPRDIADLSSILTAERQYLRKPYWSSPAFCSAYFYYFLPWNLIRQVRLLAGISLPVPERESVLLDVGSGPATFPLALWLARPDFRRIPLTIVLQDTSHRPLDFGKKLLRNLVLGQNTPWTVRVAAEPVSHCIPLLRSIGKPLFLVSCANMLNECGKGRRESANGEMDEMDGTGNGGDMNGAEYDETGYEDGQPEAYSHLLDLFDRLCDEGSHLLFLEPGTRLGGTIIMQLRQSLLLRGYSVLAPCTHSANCPLLSQKRHVRWCHFTFDSQGAPGWLTELSRACRFAKESLSLSPLLVRRGEGGDRAGCRVISQPFRVPGLRGEARYGCMERGLVLLEDAAAYSSGSLLPDVAVGGEKDAKSGALIVRSGGEKGAKGGTPRVRSVGEKDKKSGAQRVRSGGKKREGGGRRKAPGKA